MPEHFVHVVSGRPGAKPPRITHRYPSFLSEYDNLLLSHNDRALVNPDNLQVRLPPGNGATGGCTPGHSASWG